MNTLAYWISPNYDIYEVKESHISFIRKNTEMFYMSVETYNSFFEKYNEPFGWEGKAREEIIIHILKWGWIRVREHKNNSWTIELWGLIEEDEIFLKRFIENIQSEPMRKNDVFKINDLKNLYKSDRCLL